MKPDEIKRLRPGISSFLAILGAFGLFGGGLVFFISLSDLEHSSAELGPAVSAIISGILLIALGEIIAYLSRTNAWFEELYHARAEANKALQWMVDNWPHK